MASTWLLLTVLLGLSGFASACVGTPEMGHFPDPRGFGSDLRRGIATQADVREALGEPSGSGGSLLPPDHRRHDVWYYQHMKATGAKVEGEIIKGEMEHNVLLVFFNEGVLDGYLWYSNQNKFDGVWRPR